MRMRFGKFRGTRVEDLPDDYLEFLLSIAREPLRTAVEQELAARQEPTGPVLKMAGEVVTSGYRVLALKHHPDHNGGSGATMRLVNEAVGFLRGRLRELPQ